MCGASTVLSKSIMPGENVNYCVFRHLRKEVIQPHLPVRLPCYDLVLLTSFTFAAVPLAVEQATSGTPSSDHLTGVCTRPGNVFTPSWLIRDY